MIGKKWRHFRGRFYSWLRRNVFKLKEGEIAPWYAVAIGAILFPLDFVGYLQNKHGYIRYDFLRDIIKIGNFEYSVEFFASLDYNLPIGTCFKLVSRDNGVITIERIADFSSCKVANKRNGMTEQEVLWAFRTTRAIRHPQHGVGYIVRLVFSHERSVIKIRVIFISGTKLRTFYARKFGELSLA